MSLILLLNIHAVCRAADNAALSGLLITNNDVPSPYSNTITLFGLNASGAIASKTVIPTGGSGIGGGYFAANRLVVVPNGTNVCVFASDAAFYSNDVAAIDAKAQKVIGQFTGSDTDSGVTNGIGLATNAKYLYANFTSTSTIGTFQIGSGCNLTFLGDVFAAGLNGGLIVGMNVRGNFMVLTYGDGSIESFDLSAGEPISHGDAQMSAGAANDHYPSGIDITKDGRFAIFGDASTIATVEVSDLSGGKLSPTIAYNVGQGWNSGNVRLSPDESVIYVANDSGGEVTAAFFDKTTGIITKGCASPPLNGFYENWGYVGGVRTQLASGTGGLLYVPEFGGSGFSSIGILQFAVSGGTCTLTEAAGSPVVDNKDFSSLLSVQVYPGRSY